MTWKRIDKVKQMPKGLLLTGDTVCRIDPVFGQGMSIAILEAMAFRKLIEPAKIAQTNVDDFLGYFNSQFL